MKHLLSLLFYYTGDIISRTFMRWGRGYGYGVYQQLMLWSINLDTEAKIWKHVKKSGSSSKKHRK